MINWTKENRGHVRQNTEPQGPQTNGAGEGEGLPPQRLTSVVLHVIHRHVGGHKGCLAVFLLVLLLCQQTGLGILRGDDIFYFGTKGRKEPCRALDCRPSGPQE